MTNLKVYGRIFYGLGIAGIGIMHFFYQGLRPILAPIPPASTQSISALVYLLATYILLSGILILSGKKLTTTSILLALVFFLFVLFGHLPQRLTHHPEIMGSWIDAIKLFALTGGALVLFLSFPTHSTTVSNHNKFRKIATVGKYFFAFMLAFFGTAHLISGERISGLVPPYIPWSLFWTYLGGLALVGSGIAIFLNFKVRYIALLLALMLFLWFVMLHLYYAIRFPEFRDGENIMGSFVCLAFSGIALMVSQLTSASAEPGGSRISTPVIQPQG
jgi:uncharacterized membrane protein YphA (DoxX/SURF4 family)